MMYMPWIADTSYLRGEALKEAQRKNRNHARGQVKRHCVNEIQILRSKIAELQEQQGCRFCKGLPEGAEKLKHGCDSLYGLKIDWNTDTVTCPECKRCLAQWE